MAQTFVIKLGGSIVSPNEKQVFDFSYLDKLRLVLQPYIEQGNKFFIVLGGGYAMRNYRDLAEAAGLTDEMQLHWIGTTVNVLHAEIVRAYFHVLADEGVYKYEDYYNNEPLTIIKSIKVGGGGRPGASGDVDAVIAAGKLGIKSIISLKNIDGVYSADPHVDPQAKRLDSINWQQYLDIIGNPPEHIPGGNYPIDPLAAREAQKLGLRFQICLGWDLTRLQAILDGRPFNGTVVSDQT